MEGDKPDRISRIRVLQRQRVLIIQYLLLKQQEDDWHGVQDAASDLRDIDSEIKGLEFKSYKIFRPKTYSYYKERKIKSHKNWN